MVLDEASLAEPKTKVLLGALGKLGSARRW